MPWQDSNSDKMIELWSPKPCSEGHGGACIPRRAVAACAVSFWPRFILHEDSIKLNIYIVSIKSHQSFFKLSI